MLEGLFIFCLLIRAVNRGGGAEAGGGGQEGEDNRPDKKGTPCSGGNINLYLAATLLRWLGILHTWTIGEEARLCQRLSACRGMTQDENLLIREPRRL